MENEQQTGTEIPSFTLYPITTQDLKTCYESASYKIICSLTGPYYDKRLTQLQPHFNIAITNSSHPTASPPYSPEELNKFQRKLQEVLKVMVVPGRYERMVFDFNFEVIDSNEYNPRPFLLSPLLNLLNYTCVLKCLEITSIFTCSAAILRDEKLLWHCAADDRANQTDKYLILCSDQRDKRTVMSQFEGTFNFLHFERLGGALLEANEELSRFQMEKVGEVYELFHQ